MHACIHAAASYSAGQMAAVSKHYGVNGGHACPHHVCAQLPSGYPFVGGVALGIPAPSAGAGVFRQVKATTCTSAVKAPRMRRVDPTDEGLDIVILDWYRFALKTA